MALKISCGDESDVCLLHGHDRGRCGHPVEYGHLAEELASLANGNDPLLAFRAELNDLNLAGINKVEVIEGILLVQDDLIFLEVFLNDVFLQIG